ncbi:MAG TPA: MFS transporter [Steroidobacteraceae bacterium]|nr:MFS transporter [Steroidobacteraceae bacterium]
MTAPLDVEAATLRKIGWRLIPFLCLLYFAAFIDRVNVGFAALQMNRDLGFSPYVYGLGSGIFFAGYCLFEVPSNLILHGIGARRWIARIMVTWAIVAAATVFVKGATSFYVIRFLLGVAEAGFFPGVVYYLTYWVPASRRAALVGMFMTAIPISTAIGGPLSSAIMKLNGRLGIAGWQWLFLLETIPSVVLGLMTWRYLPDKPSDAKWLADDERRWLIQTLAEESRSQPGHTRTVAEALADPRVLALCLCYFGVEIGVYGVIFWVPQIFHDAGFAEGSLGILVAIPYAVAAVAMVWWCRRSDRMNERVGHVAAASAVGFLGLASSAYLYRSPALSIIAITAGAAGTLSVLPIFWTLPAGVLRGAPAAGAIALINALGNVGGFVGPYVIGWIKSVTGKFTLGLLAVAGCVLLTGFLVLWVGRRLPARPRVAGRVGAV